MLKRIRRQYEEFPPKFWTLMGVTFIDRLGGALLFPFFTLYITQKFQVGMTEAGLLFTIWSLSSLFSSTLGGALADRFGRRSIIIFSLVVSAFSNLAMGLAGSLGAFFIFAGVAGLLGAIGGPAYNAMVADLLPEEKRLAGFGLWRVIANLAVIIGPAIGGLLASQSYLWLFILDTIASGVTALLVYLMLPETKPERHPDEKPESMLQVFGGYGRILRDGLFMSFVAFSILSVLVYMQMNSTLAVFLRDVHGISTRGFGWIISLNAALVVAFQFSITRVISRWRVMVTMALGVFFYAVGFGMYGITRTYLWFIIAMVIITIGEMVVSPVSQALVVNLAPEDMRGRYSAAYELVWALPTAVGPLAAGIVMDRYDPNWGWYACFILAMISALGFLLLEPAARRRLKPAKET
jgi:MFS family permease